MDGYFVPPPPIVQFHRPHTPIAIPNGDRYQVNRTILTNFWSIRDLWLEERWPPQSEGTVAVSVAQVVPVLIPQTSMTPVVMISW